MAWTNVLGKPLAHWRLLLISIGTVYALLTANLIHAQTNNIITVGVISPKDGSSSVLTGESHEESIRLAFSNLAPLQVGGFLVKLKLVTWNDSGKPEIAAEGATRFAHEDQVAAILGPVNSGSTKAVLAQLRTEGVDLPVISSLSTAPELTHSNLRDKNFFRLIFDDTGRMSQYATFIKQEIAKAGEQRFLFLYEEDPYGTGLRNSLKDRFYTTNIDTMSWCEISAQGCNNTIMDSSQYEILRSGQSFSKAFLEQLQQLHISNIVLLGNIAGSLAIVNGIEANNLQIEYFFVGSNKRLFDEAPAGSLTIGDPVLDALRAPTPELSKAWNKLLDDFEERAKKDRADFVMTAYEAALVLHNAIHTVLSNRQALPGVDELRRELLQTLESETFDSLEPWRTISFSQGKLDQPPTAPIYRITRGITREDEVKEHQWVNISVKQYNPLFEAPVEIRLSGHRVESGELGVYRIDEKTHRAYLVERRIVKFTAGNAIEQIHLFRPGTYHFKMMNIPFYPALAETQIGLSNNYLISAISALIGALLAVSHTPSRGLGWTMRVLTGIATGILLTFGSLYGRQLASWIPFPYFSSEPVVNAMLTGLIGGLLGPYLIANLLFNWASRFLGTRKSG